MTVYSLVLFVHVGAALALASVLSIDALILFQFRRATSPTRANLWLELWPSVPWIAGGSGLLLLLSGGYLADRMSAWTLAWPKVAFADSDRHSWGGYQQANTCATTSFCT
jgi:hypothetical protein